MCIASSAKAHPGPRVGFESGVARLESGALDHDWADLDGPVEHMRFFTPAEVQAEEHIYPQFLKKGQCTGKDIYMGFEK